MYSVPYLGYTYTKKCYGCSYLNLSVNWASYILAGNSIVSWVSQEAGSGMEFTPVDVTEQGPGFGTCGREAGRAEGKVNFLHYRAQFYCKFVTWLWAIFGGAKCELPNQTGQQTNCGGVSPTRPCNPWMRLQESDRSDGWTVKVTTMIYQELYHFHSISHFIQKYRKREVTLLYILQMKKRLRD